MVKKKDCVKDLFRIVKECWSIISSRFMKAYQKEFRRWERQKAIQQNSDILRLLYKTLPSSLMLHILFSAIQFKLCLGHRVYLPAVVSPHSIIKWKSNFRGWTCSPVKTVLQLLVTSCNIYKRTWWPWIAHQKLFSDTKLLGLFKVIH